MSIDDEWEITEGYVFDNDGITVWDPIGMTKDMCGCKNQIASQVLIIHGHKHPLCPECMANVGKSVLDGLK